MKTARKSRGVSLLIVLAFIVIISVLVVGFAESMRLLRPTAASHLERARADQFAWSGVERVIAVLNQQTADTNRNWATQPGQLITGSLADDGSTTVDERKVLSQVVPLHSGTAIASADPVLAPPNLNVVTYRDPNSYLLTEKTEAGGTNAISMPVAWIYVRQSGAMDTNASPALSTTDPIVGRYAYWTDDESSKINYNIAWGRAGNTNAPGHPTRIELSALAGFSQSYADTLRNFVAGVPANTPFRFFNTPLDARRIEMVAGGAGVAAALKQNKFDVTHFNSDPNTTFFNEPRIVLTTDPRLAGWTTNASGQWVGVNREPWTNGGQPRYLRVRVGNETNDPGGPYGSSIDSSRLSETIALLAYGISAAETNSGYLRRTDWPMVAGPGSFQSKYYSSHPTTLLNGVPIQTLRLGQLAMQIVDYVRAKESTNVIVTPILSQFIATNSLSNAINVSGNASGSNNFAGISRTPYITEVGAWYGRWTNATSYSYPTIVSSNYPPQFTISTNVQTGSGTNATGTNQCMYYQFVVEIHLPKNYGLREIELTNVYLGVQSGLRTPLNPPAEWLPNGGFSGDSRKISPDEIIAGSTPLQAGDYIVVARKIGTTNSPTNAAPAFVRGAKFFLAAGTFNTFYNVVPFGQLGSSSVRIDGTNTDIRAISSLEIDDPRIGGHTNDWMPALSGTNSFGQVNGRTSLGQSDPGTVPQVDTDTNGFVTDASFYMPPPKGRIFTNSSGGIDDNTLGQVASVGELGYIHTGYQPGAITGSSVLTNAGTPWRTLRLQPSASGTNVVPDWALMDLFTAPIAPPNQYNKYVYAPHDTGFGGRVNLNSIAQPFGLERITPLAAVLQNNTYDSTDLTKKLGASTAQTIASNIFNRTLATTTPAGKQYGYTNGYDSPGEVVEVKGIADGGEKSEELVRQIMNLVTTRGNVFAVYTVGQAIKQTPDGKLKVTAQQRVQAMVERYQETTNEVRFSPVYFRNLSP